jgi:hypothetical protein
MFKGRIKDTIYWINDNDEIYYLLFPTDVSQILDEFPHVARRPGGFAPKFFINADLTKRPYQIILLVELVYHPELFSKRVSELYGIILSSLKLINKTFDTAISQNLVDFHIEFLAPQKHTHAHTSPFFFL